MRWIQTGVLVAALAAGLAVVAPQASEQGCLHGQDRTPEQKARRSQAIGLARDINNQQLKAMQTSRTYQSLDNLTLTRPVPDGFEVKLAADSKGYAFSVVDTTDTCRSGVFSNEAGLIYTGQALQ